MKSRISIEDKSRMGLLNKKDVYDINKEIEQLKPVLDDLFGKPTVVANADIFGVEDIGVARVKYRNGVIS